ncbi:MAG TPA: sulfur carrier protein ThiS [Oligoflexia bacterium]|nr:sulfur carrier protein ThiS [Oligoflexia bacterium]HMP47388.1 sulfur carrier protein ThiS [Oligoflexia bacterium]
MENLVKLVVNGDEINHQSSAPSVFTLIDSLGFSEKKIIVELNKEVVPRAEFSKTSLKNGDSIEIVQFIGGG